MSRHLTYEERCQISSYVRNGFSQAKVAKMIKRHQSVVCREIRRNSSQSEYDGMQAQKNIELRHAVANARRKKMTLELIERIHELLKESDASPEQISGRLKKFHNVQVSHETIYQFIWKDKAGGGTLYEHLRHRAKKYNKRSR